MGNSKHGRTVKLGRNESLDFLFRDHVDVCSGFIQNDDFGFPQDGTTNADELSFTRAEVCTVFGNLLQESIFALVQNAVELGFFEELDYLLIRTNLLGVQIES